MTIQYISMKIGVLDSGVGGFSVLSELYQLMPCEQYFYLSDQEHAPYGNKDTEYVIKRLHLLTDELLAEGVDLIVVACHTATAEAIDSLRDAYQLPFVGIEPYLNVLNKQTDAKENYVVLVTETTAKSARFLKLKQRLDPASLINIFACKNLASLIESYFHDEITLDDFKKGLKTELNLVLQFKSSMPKLSSAILGCTHYPLVKKQIEALTELTTIFPGDAIARRVQERLYSLFAYSSVLSPASPGFMYRRRPDDAWQEKSWNYLQKVSDIG